MSDQVVRVSVSEAPALAPDGVSAAPAAPAVPGLAPSIAAVQTAVTPEQHAAAQQEASADAGAERPSWLPEKFKSPEDMAKAYAELEKKQGGAKPAAPKGADPLAITEDAPAVVAEATPVAASVALKAAYREAEAAEGVISPETYTKLAKLGLDQASVDMHVAGQRALIQQTRSAVYDVVGGEEAYAAMNAWAKTGLTPAEKAAHNAIIDSKNPEMMKLAASALAAKFAKANGAEANLVQAGAGTGAGGDTAYANTTEMTAAINDPRYKTDAAYRTKVQARIEKSNF